MSEEPPAKSWLRDTSPEARKVLIEGYRRMSPAEKMQQVSELSKAIRQAALMRIRRQYGEMSEREEKLRLASLWIDRETMIRAFGWDPEEEGY
ncbi:MAG: hypothetical protein ACLFWL_08605 [Candidatus Brocadiia bacterium]